MKLFNIIPFMLALFVMSCDNNESVVGLNDENFSSHFTFVACEGNYGSSNGSVSVIDEYGSVSSITDIGDVVQSLEVYDDKLFVIVNNSHLIKIYQITEEGLSMPGIEISTEGSSPREMVVFDDKVYFTNWNTQDVKVLNLFNYNIEASIPVGVMPEDIVMSDGYLYVANSGESTVSKIELSSYNVNLIDVGEGPTSLSLSNDNLYISRTFYDTQWNPFYGTSKLDIVSLDSQINNYGAGIACGGSVMSVGNEVYRSFDGGIAPIDSNLDIISSEKLGNYNPSHVYNVEVINNFIWFCLTDHASVNQIKILDFNGAEIRSYDVGIAPGDIVTWQKTY